MKVQVKKFQMGGPVAAEQAPVEAPVLEAPEAGVEEAAPEADPLMQIAEMAMLALQGQDCEAAMMVCQAYLQLIQQSQGAAPEEAAPAGEPVYRAGGKLVGRINR